METTHTFVFVYAKDGMIRVLNSNDARKEHDSLIISGWQHTETLDACVWIQYLHNDCESITKEVMSLSKK